MDLLPNAHYRSVAILKNDGFNLEVIVSTVPLLAAASKFGVCLVVDNDGGDNDDEMRDC